MKNLGSLGRTRLLALAGVGVLSIAIVLAAALFVNKPAQETLYVGLDSPDLNQISMALAENNMAFEVGTDGSSITVPAGMTGKARLLLAERGLPNSANAGYELFDKVGSLGLTSFMQEVTRVRALEGEIGRTIQSISGINAARVHIVMPEVGNFRKAEQKPTASVMIRASAATGRSAASSIRHLVASAVPGLDVDDVTILDSTGQLLASGDEAGNNTLNRSLGIVQNVQQEVESNIDKALAPFLGMDNFRSSVTASLNTDAQQIQETTYDPESKVERSVRTTKEANQSSQKQSDNATTVEQNVPQAAPEAGGAAGPQSEDKSDKKEEQTNYEINSKKIATVSNGYTVNKMSIAVVVNQDRLKTILGKDATPEQIAKRVADIQKMVASATGFDDKRGDVIDVSAVEFINGLDGEPIDQPGILASIGTYTGTLINAGAFIVVVFLVAFFGLKPMAAALTASAKPAAIAGPSFDDVQQSLPTPDAPVAAITAETAGALPGARVGATPLDDLRQKIRPAPQERLARMVDLNEERTAQILRKWAAAPEAVG